MPIRPRKALFLVNYSMPGSNSSAELGPEGREEVPVIGDELLDAFLADDDLEPLPEPNDFCCD